MNERQRFMTENRQVVVAELPRGELTHANFELRTAPIPTPGDEEVLVRTVCIEG